jgi:type I restriction enzyme M protein
MRSSETRAEDVARELLMIRGWNVASPSRGGNLLWKNEYKDYPHLAEALAGRGKKGKGGDGYPDFLVVDSRTIQPLIVGETKARDDELEVAIGEADLYGDAFADGGLNVLTAGVAGDDKSNIGVRVNKRDRRGWKPVQYRSNPIQWIPTPDETSRLLADLGLFELQPRVPSNEILSKRGEEINRILRECKITDMQRPAITGAFMLALWNAKGAIRTDPEHVLSDINTECRKAFVRAGKSEIANSIYVPADNDKLAASAAYICHILRLLNITNLTAAHDYLGQLYETFFRFTGGNTIGQFFTPRHITKLIIDICRVTKSDLVVDPTCGTGGFLIACLSRMMEGKHFTHSQIGQLVTSHLVGFESEPITAALCVANMILRGDGTTGIVKDDCFTSKRFPIGKASVLIGNPPFPHEKTDDPPEKFVERGLEALSTRGTLAMIVPTSLLVKPARKEWRLKIQRTNSLKGVITLPVELFQPYATYNTSIIIIEKGVPHSAATSTFFCRVENDGFRLKKNVRIEQPGEQLTELVSSYHGHVTVPGFCTMAKLRGTGWHPGEYIEAVPHTTEQLKKEIGGLIRSLVGFHAHYAHNLAYFKSLLDDRELVPVPYGTMRKKSGRHGVEDATCIGGLFDIFYGQKALHNKENLKKGASLIISSSGSNNGCYGFFEFENLIEPPFVTVQSTGSIGEGFVQIWPCGVTDDCLILIPRSDLFGDSVDIEDYFIAAATARLENWRFDYGRKITPSRLAEFKLNRDPALKQWIKNQRTAANRLMADAIDTLSAGGTERLEAMFNELAEQWRTETGMLSVIQQKAMNPAYQRIIGLGKSALPLILKSLQNKPEHWLWALRAIAGEEIAAGALDFKAAVVAWLAWGKRKGYL